MLRLILFSLTLLLVFQKLAFDCLLDYLTILIYNGSRHTLNFLLELISSVYQLYNVVYATLDLRLRIKDLPMILLNMLDRLSS